MIEPDDRRPTDEPPPFAPGEIHDGQLLAERDSGHLSLPPRPRFVASPTTTGRRASLVSLLVAAVGLGTIGLVLVICSVGNIAGALLVAGGIFGFAAFHYLVWGWWLSARIRRRVESEQRGEDSD